MDQDKFEKMFSQQLEFIKLMQEHRNHPEVPMDLSKKENQQFLRHLTYECMGELFESNILLKNSKSHRVTDIQDFDREAYVEELSDVLHYFLGIAICSGVSCEELFNKYMEKGKINRRRILSGY